MVISLSDESTAHRGTLHRVVQALTQEGLEQVLHVDPEAFVFQVSSVVVAVLRLSGEVLSQDLEALLTRLLQLKKTRLDIVLVGGGNEAWEALVRRRPRRGNLKVGVAQVDRSSSFRALKTAYVHHPLQPIESVIGLEADLDLVPRLNAQLRKDKATARAGARGLSQFRTVMKTRKPIATWTVLAVLGLVFAAEYLLGGTESTAVLVRMGALVPERVVAGEWWRLVGATFLHAGPMHIAANGYMLYVLGGTVEKIIGPARFILIYVTSALCGSLASLMFLDGIGVGASGAVWGLLTASAVLAFRENGLLPAALVPGAQRAAKINLVLNVGISFAPHVDKWAHFGGGAAGAILMASGLIAAGLPRFDGETPMPPAVPKASWAVRGLCVLGTLIMAAGLALSLTQGRAHELLGPTLQEARLVDIGRTMRHPTFSHAESRFSFVDGQRVAYAEIGDFSLDPVVTELFIVEIPATVPAELEQTRDVLLEQWDAPDQTTLLVAPHGSRIGDSPAFSATYVFGSSGVQRAEWLIVRPGEIVRMNVHAYDSQGLPSNAIVESMLLSIAPLE